MTAEQKTHILVIEDEKNIANELTKNLKRDDYEVSVAYDGEKGLEAIKTEQPDLVTLDILLPGGLDGLTVLRIARKDKNVKISDVPIIVLSARDNVIDKITALNAGADDYVPKPFHYGELHARIEAVNRRGSQHRAHESLEMLISGNLRVDLRGHRVFQGSDELKLSPKEFSLLVVLMKDKGAVLSRDLLINRIWGEDYFGDQRTIDVHVTWLRQMIEEDPSDPKFIIGVRGVGYRFDGE